MSLQCNVPQTRSNGATEGGVISLSKSPIATSKTAFDGDKRKPQRAWRQRAHWASEAHAQHGDQVRSNPPRIQARAH